MPTCCALIRLDCAKRTRSRHRSSAALTCSGSTDATSHGHDRAPEPCLRERPAAPIAGEASAQPYIPAPPRCNGAGLLPWKLTWQLARRPGQSPLGPPVRSPATLLACLRHLKRGVWEETARESTQDSGAAAHAPWSPPFFSRHMLLNPASRVARFSGFHPRCRQRGQFGQRDRHVFGSRTRTV
jgi:hypothetical protein